MSRSWSIIICICSLIFIGNFWLFPLSFLNGLDSLKSHLKISIFDDPDTEEFIDPKKNHEKLKAFLPWQYWKDSLISGYPRKSSGFLTIGISIVYRDQENYFVSTIQSIINTTSEENRAEVTLVILLADLDKNNKSLVFESLQLHFLKWIISGFIQLIERPDYYYPPLDQLLLSLGNSAAITRWRAKQSLDYSFLWSYCRNLSTYYLQLEDDIKCSPNFLVHIKKFINILSNVQWITLEFSKLGYIGKLYHSEHLDILASFAYLFYFSKPIDWLMIDFQRTMGQNRSFIRVPALFQHCGYHSSLPGRIQSLTEDFFDEGITRKYVANNPPAILFSDIQPIKNHFLQLVYSSLAGMTGEFWGKPPKANQQIRIVFQVPLILSEIIILTGDCLKLNILEAGRLDVYAAKPCDELNITASRNIWLGNFYNGCINITNIELKIPVQIRTLLITVTKSQNDFLIVKEIDIFEFQN